MSGVHKKNLILGIIIQKPSKLKKNIIKPTNISYTKVKNIYKYA